ncbi:hypothetical protein [Myroides sp. N17-2]|uniref:hypothetical protein n=1 Tax=Myroides sp. N17-2 TaxID=2030799 RepID=UPI000EFA491E|nr:hypothetical protein [Myroides sp. N17-2]
MIKDFFVSFTDNIKEKTRNPFLGTYAVVWLIRNWYVVYMVFNFDKDCTMDDKLRLISEYFGKNPFWENVGYNVLYTFAVLLATYILLNLSRLIVNGFERNLTPWIYKVTDKSSIVTKDTYQIALTRIEKMESDLESEKEKRYRAEEKSEKSEKELISERTNILDYNVIKEEKNRLIKDIQDKDNMFKELDTKYKVVEQELSKLKSNDSNVEKYYSILLKEELKEDFVKCVSSIRKGFYIANSIKGLSRFLELGFFEVLGNSGDKSKFKLSKRGEEVIEYINLK